MSENSQYFKEITDVSNNESVSADAEFLIVQTPNGGNGKKLVRLSLADIATALQGIIGSGGGLSDDAKQALLALLEKVAYIDDDGQYYYDALEAALYPPANLVSISASFNQGGAVIYDTDSLDTLRQYLTVTAYYDDSTSDAVTGYTLSGTLSEGTSTITASYGGKTDTFSVTVTHVDNTLVYSLPSPTVFDGSSTVVNTGISLFANDSDFSLLLTFKSNMTQNQFSGVWSSGDGNNKIYALRPNERSGAHTTYGGGKTSGYTGATFSITNDNDVVRYVLRHVQGSKFEIFASVNGTTAVNGTQIGVTSMPTTSVEVRLGKSHSNQVYWAGTVNDCKMYTRALTNDEIATYLAG